MKPIKNSNGKRIIDTVNYKTSHTEEEQNDLITNGFRSGLENLLF